MAKGSAFDMKSLAQALKATKKIKKTLTEQEKELKKMKKMSQGLHEAFANLLVDHRNEIRSQQKNQPSKQLRPGKAGRARTIRRNENLSKMMSGLAMNSR